MQRPALRVDFLLWLDEYVGMWDCEGQRYRMDRRPDGWLEARTSDYKKAASLKWLLANGRRIKPPTSPLGNYPVTLSQDVMRLWLKPDEFRRFREAWRVRLGMELLLQAIERNIRESDEATRRKKFEAMWAAARSRSRRWTKEDAEVSETLMAEFKSAKV
jgi:hypothetical protein